MSHPQNQLKIEPQGDAVDPVVDSGDTLAERFRDDISSKQDLTVFGAMNERSIASAEKSLQDNFGGLSLVSRDGGDLPNDPAARAFGAFENGLHRLNDRDFAGLAQRFQNSPEEFRKFIETQMNGGLSEAERDARISGAQGEVGQVSASMNGGYATLASVGALLSKYSQLSFPEGSSMQAVVGAMMDKVRAAIDVETANRNHPTGFSNQFLVSNRRNLSDVQRLSENA